MRVERRRLRAGELDHELIWLAVTVGAALLGFIWLALHLPWPSCTFRSVTGWPCATCGATRASLAFLQGDLGAAWRFNPMIAMGLVGIVLFDLYALWVVSTRARRVRFTHFPMSARKWIAGAIVLTVAGNWVYLLRSY